MSAPTTIMCDNKSAIKLCKNLVFHDKTKHFEIHWHFIGKKIKEKIVQVDFINTTKQPANMFTKALSQIKFETCRRRFNHKNVEFQS
jgi:hypothetical protein